MHESVHTLGHSVVLGVAVFSLGNAKHWPYIMCKGVNVNACKLLARFTILSFSGMHFILNALVRYTRANVCTSYRIPISSFGR